MPGAILHVIKSLDPREGGPVEGIRQMIDAYAALGWRIDVACLDDPAAPWLAAFPAKIHALGPGKGGYGFRWDAVARLRALAKNYDALIGNGIWEFSGPLTMLAAAGSGTPYYFYTHGMLDPWFKRQYPTKHLKKWLYWPWSVYWVLRRAEAVLFTTEEERILARQSFWLYRCNEAVVGYGASRPPGDAETQKAAFAAAFPETQGVRNLLFLGRIDPKKGCDLLIEAFAAKFGGSPDWRLVMAGPDQGGWRPALEAMAGRLGVKDQITWTGSLGGDLKWGAFRSADAFILPSHQENFGVAVVEALACSTPVLISDRVNIWREIVRDQAGLAASDDLPGTISLMDRWAALTPDEASRMRANAPKCFDENFETEFSARRLIDLIQTRANRAKARQ